MPCDFESLQEDLTHLHEFFNDTVAVIGGVVDRKFSIENHGTLTYTVIWNPVIPWNPVIQGGSEFNCCGTDNQNQTVNFLQGLVKASVSLAFISLSLLPVMYLYHSLTARDTISFVL